MLVPSNQISEIKFVNKNNSNHEVLLFPLNTKVRIRTENTINENLIKQIFVVLDIYRKKWTRVRNERT